MPANPSDLIEFHQTKRMDGGTLLLAFSGWMDGGDVSTGTVSRMIELLGTEPFADLDPEPFYIFNFPGSMEIEDGLVRSIEMPSNTFVLHRPSKLLLFVGKEPNLYWHTFADCIFEICRRSGIERILFVGSFGGAVPHTRQPRLYMTCSDSELLDEMRQFGIQRTGYEGPGSFMTYLMTRVSETRLKMVSLVAEIPGYLQGKNPLSIEAVTRRLAQILQLPLDLDSLRAESNEWEAHVSTAVEDNEELATQVRDLERQYDNDLLDLADDES